MKGLIVVFASNITGFDEDFILEKKKEDFRNIKEDYHFLIIQDPAREKVEVQVFSDKNIEPIEFENLKKLIKTK